MARREPIPYLPGDLIGFSGYSLESVLINLGTVGIPFYSLSHVAIVGPHPLKPEEFALWESTSRCDLPCLLQGEPVSGVQCHTIRERIETYRGKVYHYPLSVFSRARLDSAWPWPRVYCYHYPLSVFSRARLFEGELSEFLHEQVGKGYDAIEAFRSRQTALGWIERRLTRENHEALFCSELVAAAWKAAGLWYPPDWRWNPNRLARTALSIGLVRPRRRVR
jgi:hypothetical protein